MMMSILIFTLTIKIKTFEMQHWIWSYYLLILEMLKISFES